MIYDPIDCCPDGRCTLSPEVYRWQHEGGWKTGRLVMSDGNVLTRQHGEMSLRDCFTDHQLQVFDPLAEAPGLSFIPWVELTAELAREAVTKLEAQILAITTDWPKTNARRAELIRRKVARTITDAEREELNRLQMFATARQCLFAPPPLEQMEKVRDEAQLDAIRAALGMPEGTVPEMCERIGELRRDSLGDVLNS